MSVEVGQLEESARDLARVIKSSLTLNYGANRVGFVVLLFDFGPGGHMTYLSSANRSDMIRALKELLGKLET